MREVVLDTETTGLDPGSGHRIVEIACLELARFVPTGRQFQTYIDPERDMPEDARAIHGLNTEFLSQHPVFADIQEALFAFIGDAPLVIHNAQFDLRFLNAELGRLDLPPIAPDRAVDTVALARQKFPGAQANLDALCRRFQIDNTDRTLHGALKDARLLAEVYLELTGGRQQGLELAAETVVAASDLEKNRHPPRPHAPSAEEETAHALFLGKIKKPIWNG